MTDLDGHLDVEELLQLLHGELEEERSEAIARHLERCSACATTAAEVRAGYEAASLLGGPTTDEIAQRVLARAHLVASASEPDQGSRGSGARAGWTTLVLTALTALVIGGVGGSLLGDRSAPEEAEPGTHLLLLGAPTAEGPSRLDAYQLWSAELRRNGSLVAAEALTDRRFMAGTTGAELQVLQGALDAITGFYLIRAADDSEALEIAGQSPPVQRGDGVLVLPILPTDRVEAGPQEGR